MNDMDSWHVSERSRRLESVQIAGVPIRRGDCVRLRPRRRADILDLALEGRVAIIEAIEQDLEERIYLSVVLEDDPGRDLGELRQAGHRFFFTPEEVEPLRVQGEIALTVSAPRNILIAGIGNVFLGDDAFGVEVVKRLSRRNLPEHVRIVDFGIRGIDLAYALMDVYDLAILVDAAPRGRAPGTVYVLELDLNSIGDNGSSPDGHTMDPVQVLHLVRAMGGSNTRMLLVGCEPGRLECDWDDTGLSPEVEMSVQEAIGVIEKLCGDGHRPVEQSS